MSWESEMCVMDNYMIDCMVEEFEGQYGTAWDHDEIWQALDHCEGSFADAFEHLRDQSEFEYCMGG